MIKTENILELLRPLVKEVLESMLKEERDIYLEDNPHTKGNGYYERALKTAFGELRGVQIPRTRDNEFKSILIPYRKHNTEDLEALIRAMLISGVSTRKISEVLKEIYGVDMSCGNISRISQVCVEEIQKWRNRPLMEEYAVVFLDAMMFPIKRDKVEKEAIYVALGIRTDGRREILGYYLPGGSESAHNWGEILLDIKERGVKRIHFIVSDGLSGIKNIIEEIYPQARYQTCTIHIERNILSKVRVQHRSIIASEIKEIFHSRDKVEAEELFTRFIQKWRGIYPRLMDNLAIIKEDLFTYMELPEAIRGMVYTTNVLERLFKEIKRRLKSMEMFQSEASAEKYLYWLLKYQNERFLSRRLKNWEYYFQLYCEQKGCKGENIHSEVIL